MIGRSGGAGAAGAAARQSRPRGEARSPASRSGARRKRQARRAALALGAPRGAENGIDPATIKGTGKDGRLTKEDVIAARHAPRRAGAGRAAPPPPSRCARRRVGGGRREERVKMTRLRQTIAKRLKDAQETAALLTTFNDVDMTAVMERATSTRTCSRRSTA